MLFGSAARNEIAEHSDIDLLVIQDSVTKKNQVDFETQMKQRIDPRFSITFYSFGALRSLVSRGSIFAMHLAREGQIIEDPKCRLQKILSAPNSIDFDSEREVIRASSEVLYATDVDLEHPAAALISIHLLRRAALLRCAERGNPKFATRAVAEELADERLSWALAKTRGPCAVSCRRSILAEYVGLPHLRAKNLTALVQCPTTHHLAEALVKGADVIGYSDYTTHGMSLAA
jgi:hypothetical protein